MTWYPNQGNRVSGIDQLTVVYGEFLYIYAVSSWQLRIANRPDNESEKMTNFLRRDRRIMSNARLRATSSAVKILA